MRICFRYLFFPRPKIPMINPGDLLKQKELLHRVGNGSCGRTLWCTSLIFMHFVIAYIQYWKKYIPNLSYWIDKWKIGRCRQSSRLYRFLSVPKDGLKKVTNLFKKHVTIFFFKKHVTIFCETRCLEMHLCIIKYVLKHRKCIFALSNSHLHYQNAVLTPQHFL